MMYRHSRRGFALIIVIVLLSLAAVAETLATSHLMRLRRHVIRRKQVVQKRVWDSGDITKPQASQPAPIRPRQTTQPAGLG